MTYIRETITRRTNTMNEPDDPHGLRSAVRTPPIPAGLGAQSFEQALAPVIEPPPRETSGLPVIRAVSFRYDPEDGDVMVKIQSPTGMAAEVAIDDPLALLAVTMAAIKFGHPPDVLVAAQKLVSEFGKERTK